jgi:hypothetical protein
VGDVVTAYRRRNRWSAPTLPTLSPSEADAGTTTSWTNFEGKMNLDEAREQLINAALNLGERGTQDIGAVRALCEAATAYGKERDKATPRNQTRESTSLTLPFGREKNVPLNEAKTGNLKWMRGCLVEMVADPAKEKYREKNQALLEAIDRELESRGEA